MSVNSTGHLDTENYKGARYTMNTPSSAFIGMATTEILAENLDRAFLSLSNDSLETIYIAWGNDATMNTGFALLAGQTLILSGRDVPTHAINGIASTGGTITYQEGQA